MSNTMAYKGYTASVEFSEEDSLFVGKLMGIRDRILFDGEDVKTLQNNFHGAVDEYLSFCLAEGKTPDKPFKGSVNIRIPAELHRSLAMVAEHEHKSLNSVITDRLDNSFRGLELRPYQVAPLMAQRQDKLGLSDTRTRSAIKAKGLPSKGSSKRAR